MQRLLLDCSTNFTGISSRNPREKASGIQSIFLLEYFRGHQFCNKFSQWFFRNTYRNSFWIRYSQFLKIPTLQPIIISTKLFAISAIITLLDLPTIRDSYTSYSEKIYKRKQEFLCRNIMLFLEVFSLELIQEFMHAYAEECSKNSSMDNLRKSIRQFYKSSSIISTWVFSWNLFRNSSKNFFSILAKRTHFILY